uniref:Alpha-2-HS-glycoprotein-like n=1 Tax=Acanthochromis polyacanthus TaxID=80966 RepID=A0A3Q1H3W8_9TELE
MKVSPVFILLFPAVLLCGAAPALEALSCSDNSSFAAARMAVIHINEHHNHGYKFRLSQITGSNVEQIDDGCNLELQLELLETKCHVVNPKHFEDCEIREDTDRIVKANCTVGMTVKNGDAKVSKYECDTQQAKTNKELWLICPDCPTLDPIESPESVNIAHETLTKINANTSHQHLYTLLEVGRMLSSYIPFTGMQYSGELVFVETNCPVGSKILPKACTPLCPDRALQRHPCIMLSVIHLFPQTMESSLLSVISIPLRTLLHLALVNKSPYVGVTKLTFKGLRLTQEHHNRGPIPALDSQTILTKPFTPFVPGLFLDLTRTQNQASPEKTTKHLYND